MRLPQGWKPPAPPERFDVKGRYVHVVPLEAAAHGEDLFEAFRKDETGAGWTYLTNGPFEKIGDFMDWLKAAEASTDPMFFAYLNASTGRAIGYGALMRINAPMGSIEIGNNPHVTAHAAKCDVNRSHSPEIHLRLRQRISAP